MTALSEKRLQDFLEEIRSCRHCRTDSPGTPFVYGTSKSDILVVSEMPPKRA